MKVDLPVPQPMAGNYPALLIYMNLAMLQCHDLRGIACHLRPFFFPDRYLVSIYLPPPFQFCQQPRPSVLSILRRLIKYRNTVIFAAAVIAQLGIDLPERASRRRCRVVFDSMYVLWIVVATLIFSSWLCWLN